MGGFSEYNANDFVYKLVANIFFIDSAHIISLLLFKTPFGRNPSNEWAAFELALRTCEMYFSIKSENILGNLSNIQPQGQVED